MSELDLAIVGQDPWFGGGFRTYAETLWRGAQQLGRRPHLFYLSRTRSVSVLHRSLALVPVRETQGIFEGTAFPSFLPELDGVNQLVGGRRIAPAVRNARSLWVCAASAPYGYAALRSGRPYACWIATSLAGEWEVRRPRLPRSRRLALRVNAPLLVRLEREVLQGAAAVYAISPYSRHAIAEAAGLPVERVGAIPIPIDLTAFEPEPEEQWTARLDAPVISFVGRANDPRKNLPLLLAAFRRVRERLPGARLRLIGEPPPARSLDEGVEAVGFVDSVPAALRGSTLFALPSLQEGFGIVVAEALLSGIPAIVTPSGGPEELVHNSGGGVVVDGFDPAELARAILTVLDDVPGLLEMRVRGRAYVEDEHSPERFRARLADAFAALDNLA